MSTTVATSLKLPAECTRLREQFTQDALAAEREIRATGLGQEWEDVRAYFAQMAQFRASKSERPAPLIPKRVL